jgi:hypothetical protein
VAPSPEPSRWRRVLRWLAPRVAPFIRAYLEAYLKKQAEKAQK